MELVFMIGVEDNLVSYINIVNHNKTFLKHFYSVSSFNAPRWSRKLRVFVHFNLWSGSSCKYTICGSTALMPAVDSDSWRMDGVSLG